MRNGLKIHKVIGMKKFLVYKIFVHQIQIAALKVPGMPTTDNGYKPPKQWNGKKVKNPNGRRSYGWPDSQGNVWIPSGPNGRGGPHWMVQKPDGSYENIFPDGKEYKHEFYNNNFSL